MNTSSRNELFQQAKQWVLEAGANIRTQMIQPMEIDTKSNANDLVTSVDKKTEQFFVERIHQHYPDHQLLGEEGYGDDVKELTGVTWIIDPIDGTMNFVHQKRNFAISVGIYQDAVGEIGLIYDVMNDVLYHALRDEGAYRNGEKLPQLKPDVTLETTVLGMNHYMLCPNRLLDEQVMHQLVKRIRGVRTYGSAAIEFAYVAEGILDGYAVMRLSPWDFAAGMIIVHEVGGVTTNLTGNAVDMLQSGSILVSHPNIHRQLIEEYFIKAKK